MIFTLGVIWEGSFFKHTCNYIFVRFKKTHLPELDFLNFFTRVLYYVCSSEGFSCLGMIWWVKADHRSGNLLILYSSVERGRFVQTGVCV